MDEATRSAKQDEVVSRLFHTWNWLTSSFIVVSVVLVAGAFVVRSWEHEQNLHSLQRSLIDSYIEDSYGSIAESIFLKLDNMDLRRHRLQDLVGDGVQIHLNFVARPDGSVSDDEPKQVHWVAGTDTHDRLLVPIRFGDQPLGVLQVDVAWADNWFFGDLASLVTTIFVVVASLILIWALLFQQLRRRVLLPMTHRIMAAQTAHAVSETAQMLAHDVRKPFALVRNFLQTVARSSDLERTKRYASSVLPQVETATAAVDQMLDDASSICTEDEIKRTPVAPETLVDWALREITGTPKEPIAVSYDFRHQHNLSVSAVKIRRVVVNLVRNAIEELDKKRSGTDRRLWFRTQEIFSGGKTCIKICVGNSGSPIAPALQESIFDLFVTRGKKGGQGLGLAIVKNLVEAHGGRAQVRSSREYGTEFQIFLPADVTQSYQPVLTNLPTELGQHDSVNVEPRLTKEIPRLSMADRLRRDYGRRTKSLKNRQSLVAGLAIVATHIGSALAAAMATIFLWQTHPQWALALYPVVAFFIGTRFRALGNIVHECSHSLFVRGVRWNRWIGQTLATLDFSSLEQYRAEHDSHHRFLGDPQRDLDFQPRRKFGFGERFAHQTIYHLVVPLTLIHLPSFLRAAVVWPMNRQVRGRCAIFLALMLGVGLSLVSWTHLLLFYVLPYLTTYQIIRYWSDAIDHAGLLQNTEEFFQIRNHMFRFAPLNWLIFPRSDQYHLLHHLFPEVPVRSYRQLHKILMDDPVYRARNHSVVGRDRPQASSIATEWEEVIG